MSDITDNLAETIRFALGHEVPKYGLKIKDERTRSMIGHAIAEKILGSNFVVLKGRYSTSESVASAMERHHDQVLMAELINRIEPLLPPSDDWENLKLMIRKRLP